MGEAILIWCQCRTREYDNVNITDFTQSWANGLAFCALIHNFFPNAFDYNALKIDSARDRLKNYEVAFVTGEKFAGVPDFLTAEDMSAMVEEQRIDPKMTFSTCRRSTGCATSSSGCKHSLSPFQVGPRSQGNCPAAFRESCCKPAEPHSKL